ncbi:MAG: AAA family ATPase [Deltaproteobacteria bacterium]|nr:AAA family ATPase [Deltaproteobacteria bacterium]NIS77073.1 AAA family ATPase [Deltaproteobacteria bacterium]
MGKNFVLDTNVLLHDPYSLFKFHENTLVVPITVIEELDKFKKDLNMVGRNARVALRIIDSFRSAGSLAEGVRIESNGGSIKVVFDGEGESLIPKELRGSKEDNEILAVALGVREREKSVPVILVSKDTNLRIKADALGIKAEDFESDRVGSVEELYDGFVEVFVPKDKIDALYRNSSLSFPDLELYPNQCVLLKEQATGASALGIFDRKEGVVKLVPPLKEGVWGIKPRNKEQHFALALLLDDSIKLVTLPGKAGTGKTLIALAAGLRAVSDERAYSRLLVSRPVFPLGRDIGFLPGDVEEKLKPWMQPIFDNIEYLFGMDRPRKRQGIRGYQELINLGILEIEPLTYIRGRSIPNQYIIIDEAQNLTPHEVKTILTRAGENTKVVLTGDPYQIDNPFIDSASNGLSHVVEKFKDEPLAGTIMLVKGERSKLAELASNIL